MINRVWLAAAGMIANAVTTASALRLAGHASAAQQYRSLVCNALLPARHARAQHFISTLRLWQPTNSRLYRTTAAFSNTEYKQPATTDSPVYDSDFDPDYGNFVAITGTVRSPQAQGYGPDKRYSFTLMVKQIVKQQPGEPDVYDAFTVDASSFADEASSALKEDMLVTVQGKLRVVHDESTADPQVKIFANDIARLRHPSPESLVSQQAPPQPANTQQYQQQPAAADVAEEAGPDAAAGGGLGRVPGMPDMPRDEREESWMHLFQNPQEWYDNRERKQGRQPDFKAKNTGRALWIESNATPEWVFNNLQLLPGNKPYVPSATASQGGGGSSSGWQQPQQRPVFMPAEPSSDREAAWMDVFLNYRQYWDNRANKLNPKAPDFKHKSREVALWINSRDTPSWVVENIYTALPAPPPPRTQ